jgi:outer membrane autotransporter protein
MEGKIMVIRKVAFANAVAFGALAMSFGTSAPAADLSRRPPPPMMAPFSPWDGFYVGAHVGGVSSSETVDGLSTDPSGVTGGLQAGYNFHIAPAWLVGVEGELSWTNADGTSADGVRSAHNWYDTFDARLGYILPNGWLLYGKAGAAWMNADYSDPGSSVNQTRSGWNIGVGAEFFVAPRWSVKAEYNFLDFGTDNTFFGVADTQVNEFKLGVNYHFMPGALFGRW